MKDTNILHLSYLHPFRLMSNLSEFRNELLLIGVTYYARMLVFKHLNIFPKNKIGNFEIDEEKNIIF